MECLRPSGVERFVRGPLGSLVGGLRPVGGVDPRGEGLHETLEKMPVLVGDIAGIMKKTRGRQAEGVLHGFLAALQVGG